MTRLVPTNIESDIRGVITDSQCAYNVHSNSRSQKEWSEVHDNMDAASKIEAIEIKAKE
jgi:hypothetical protein